MFQNLRNKRQSNILAGNFELSESPVSFNITPLSVSAGNNSVFNNPVNTAQPVIDRTMFNQLNNIRFPTQGKYMYNPPDSQNVDMNFFRRSPPPQSMASLQTTTSNLLSQGNAILERDKTTDVRNANTVAALSNPNLNVLGTGFNLVGNQIVTESSLDRNLQRGLLNFKINAARNTRNGRARR
jgi:hypothetical protein